MSEDGQAFYQQKDLPVRLHSKLNLYAHFQVNLRAVVGKIALTISKPLNCVFLKKKNTFRKIVEG